MDAGQLFHDKRPLQVEPARQHDGENNLQFFGASSASGQGVAYDPVIDAVWEWKSVNGLFWKWDVQSNTGTNIGQLAPTSTLYMSGAIDPLHHKLWFLGTSDFVHANAGSVVLDGTNNYTDEHSNISGCDPASGAASANSNGWPGFEWDPLSSRFAVFSPDNSSTEVYWFDPVSKVCSPINVGGSMPTFASSYPTGTINQTAGRFRMIPDMPGKALYVPPNSSQDAFIITLEPPGLGASFINNSTGYCLDKDGDTYGIGPACTGPDADDNDSSVHTGPQVITKYGSLLAFLAYRQYNPTHIWYVAPASPTAACLANGGSSGDCTGNNGTGVVDDVHHPFLNWSSFSSSFNADVASMSVMVIARDGWSDNVFNNGSGTATLPAIFLSYPGEHAVLNPATVAGSQINCNGVSGTIIDGINTVGTAGYNCNLFHDSIIRNVDGSGNGGGSGNGALQSFDGMVNTTFEDNVWHDTTFQHVVYIGSRNNPSSNVRFQRNVMYNAAGGGFPAFQFNGRCIGCFFEQNVVYNVPASTPTASFAFYNGVKNSFIRSNLIFNGGGDGILVENYDGDCFWGSPLSSGICPYDETGNVVQNNTIYVPATAVDGASASQNPAIEIVNATSGCPPSYSGAPDFGSFNIGDTVMSPWVYNGGTVYTATSA